MLLALQQVFSHEFTAHVGDDLDDHFDGNYLKY